VSRCHTESDAPESYSDRHPAMTQTEAHQAFDNASRRYLQMSGEDFLRKWRVGYFKGKREIASKVDAVSILLPLVER
jgi:hypothetical protein